MTRRNSATSTPEPPAWQATSDVRYRPAATSSLVTSPIAGRWIRQQALRGAVGGRRGEHHPPTAERLDRGNLNANPREERGQY
jgi:hypothetical protein